jgi:hypothetical protein
MIDMATRRPTVPADTKRLLIEQGGNKCANPGCPNVLIEIHHIHEWHIYQTHDADHMIAICPSCHDCVDRGDLQILDETLYKWKGIDRRNAQRTGHIFVEPGEPPCLQLGSINFQGDSGLIFFDFDGEHRLAFAVRDNDILLLNLKLAKRDGSPILDVVDGYVRLRDPSLEMKTRPGKIYIKGGIDSEFLPGWARAQLMREDQFNRTIKLPLLDVEVIAPGQVKVQGIWMNGDDGGVIIRRDKLSFVRPGYRIPISIACTSGGIAEMRYVGPIGTRVFEMAPNYSATSPN